MTYLLLSILLSTFLFVIFKLFDKYNINILQAIVVNYVIACICGLLSYSETISVVTIINKPWFIGTILLGILFIAVFNIMAITAQKNGLSVASVAGKMSVIIPVIFAVLVYNEKLNIIKTIGIVMALVAVYLVSVKEDAIEISKKTFIYPLLLFLGSGVIDTSLKYLETNYVSKSEISLFSASIFGVAAVIGSLILIVTSIKNNSKITTKNILGGIILGVFNYYSIFFLMKALKSSVFNSSTIFTINNVAIVMLTTLVGILLFKEKLILKNWVGIAIISIILVAFL